MIGVAGLNHTTAAVAVRERVVFNEEEIGRFIAALRKQEPFTGGVVLCTCNRTEVYFSSPATCAQQAFSALIRVLCAFKRIDAQVGDHLYTYRERDAVRHLFRVAAGLDSMVLGENQILGQVKNAYRISASRKLTGRVLNRLFHKAFEVGKTVRSETAINQGASSMGYAAVELAAGLFPDLPEHPVLLVGSGQAGEMVLQSLAKRGARRLYVANRTEERARALAGRFHAEAVPFDRMLDCFCRCDIIIVATASRRPLVTLDHLREVMRRRRDRSLCLIDLSVPRDVETGARELERVFVYDVDDLESVVARNRESRRVQAREADRIVERHIDDFFTWLDTLELAPTLARLQECFDAIPAAELASLKNRLPPESYDRVREFSAFLTGKYLGLIAGNLKALSREGRGPEYIDLVNRLFGLRPGEDG